MINEKNTTQALDEMGEVAKKLFHSLLENEVDKFIDKNKDRIISETILRISKEMSVERFGQTIRIEVRTDSKF